MRETVVSNQVRASLMARSIAAIWGTVAGVQIGESASFSGPRISKRRYRSLERCRVERRGECVALSRKSVKDDIGSGRGGRRRRIAPSSILGRDPKRARRGQRECDGNEACDHALRCLDANRIASISMTRSSTSFGRIGVAGADAEFGGAGNELVERVWEPEPAGSMGRDSSAVADSSGPRPRDGCSRSSVGVGPEWARKWPASRRAVGQADHGRRSVARRAIAHVSARARSSCRRSRPGVAEGTGRRTGHRSCSRMPGACAPCNIWRPARST